VVRCGSNGGGRYLILTIVHCLDSQCYIMTHCNKDQQRWCCLTRYEITKRNAVHLQERLSQGLCRQSGYTCLTQRIVHLRTIHVVKELPYM